MPLFSIITPTFNCKEDLELTLESLHQQTFKDFEHIIIDGGSTDGTLEVIEANDKNVKYWVSEKDNGLYDAMNKGIKQASGDYLEFLNAGDIYQDCNALAKIADKASDLSNHVLYGEIILVDKSNNDIYPVKPVGFSLDVIKARGTACLNHQSMFTRKDVVPKYSLRYPLKGELNWYIDIAESVSNLKTCYVKHPIIRYKLGGLINVNYLDNLKEWILVVQKRFGLIQNN